MYKDTNKIGDEDVQILSAIEEKQFKIKISTFKKITSFNFFIS